MRIIPVIGLPLAATNYTDAITWILEKSAQPTQAFAVEAANTHVAALAKTDPRFSASMEKFDLCLPDGMPLVWSLNAQLPEGKKLTDRVYGPTLMLKTVEATGQQNSPTKHFLLGGAQSTLDKLSTFFSEKCPSADLAGSYSPPFGKWPDDENERIFEKIRLSGATLIWVGLGCPKQENWIAENKDRLPPGVYFGIGAAFAFHAGEVKQAPAIIQKIGLEWLFRLAKEPRRLFKRYLTYNSLFLFHLLKDRC